MSTGIILAAALLLVSSAPYATPAGEEKVDKGVSPHEAKKYREAEALLRQVVAEDPDNPLARSFLGLSLLELNKHSEALQELKRADELGPPSEPVKVGLARVYMEQKDLNRAGAALEAAMKLNSESADVFYYRGMLGAHRRDYASSARDFEKAIELDPKDAYSYDYAGMACNSLKRPDKMVEHFQT